MGQRLIKSCGCKPTPSKVHCPIPTVSTMSGKRLGDIESHLVFDDVVTRPAQLVCHRFDRYHSMALGFLSLVVAFDPGTEPNREVGRFDKRPRQILVAVLGIAPAF